MKIVILSFTAALAAILSAEAKVPVRIDNDTLNVSKVVSLEEVMVTATRASRQTPVAYSELSSQELKRRNDGQSLPSLILQSPSVIMTSDGGNGIGYSTFRIRGTDANRINITVNGVPMNDAESHTVFWVNMPDFASSVKNIQIQRGAGTSTNGAAAFGATVSMQTENPPIEHYFDYSSSIGSFGTFRNTFQGGTGLLGNHLVIDARYSNIRTDGYVDRAKAKMQSYFGSATWYAENTMLKFQTFGSAEKTYQAWDGVPKSMLKTNRTYNPCGEYEEDGKVKFYNNQTDNYWQQHYHLLASERLNENWDMNLTLHYTHGEGYYEDYKSKQKFSKYNLSSYISADGETVKKSDLVRRKWLDNDFYGAIYSANYHAERAQLTIGTAANNYEGAHYGRVMWVKNAAALPKPDYEYYRNKGKKFDYNGFAKMTYSFTPNLSLYADMQYRGIHYTIKGLDDKAGDVDISKDWHFFNPKAGLTFSGKNNTAFLSFSTAHREPNRDNFTEAGADERPTYETLYDYEAGYTFRSSVFSVGATLYYMNYDNQLILTGKISEIGEALTSNIKDSYRSGIELTASVKPLNWLSWNGNMTLSRNKIRHFTENIEVYDADWNYLNNQENVLGTTNIAFSPEFIANSLFTFNWKHLDAGFNSQYVGRQYIDNTSCRDRSLDPYFVTNLRFGCSFKPAFMKELRFDLSINNLFNEKYETNAWVYCAMVAGSRYTEDGYFPQAGRNMMFRAVFNF